MKLTGAQKTLFGVLLTAVFFTGMGSASYYFGVKTLDTDGIAKLNDGIANIKSKLADAQASNATLSTQLGQATDANTDLTTKLNSATADKSTLQAALDDRFSKLQSLGTLLGIDTSSYANTSGGAKALATAITDKITSLQSNSSSGDTTALQQQVDNLTQTNTALQDQITALQSTLSNFGVTGDISTPTAVAQAINDAVVAGATKAVSAFTDTINAIGVDVSWVTLGPTYHEIDNPKILFNNSSISPNLASVKVSVLGSTSTTALLPVVYAGSGTGVSNALIWTGFGWLISNSDFSQVYTEKTTVVNGTPQSAGVGWANTTDLFTQITVPGVATADAKRLLLWGSAQHNFVKAFVPDFSTLPQGNFSMSSTDNTVTFTPYDTSTYPNSYTLNILPNYAESTDSDKDSKYVNLTSQLTSAGNSLGGAPVYIQKANPFVIK